LLNDDDELEKVWKSQYALSDLVADKEFKTYDALKDRLEKVLGLNGSTPVVKTTVEQMKAAPKKPAAEPDMAIPDDDDMAYFAKLAQD